MADPVPPPGPNSPPDRPPDRPGLWDWLFRNRDTGRITIAQFPNAALWLFVAATALRWIIPSGSRVHTAAAWLAVAALAWWAGDEVVRGVNPWRRVLGLVGCALVVAGAVALFR